MARKVEIAVEIPVRSEAKQAETAHERLGDALRKNADQLRKVTQFARDFSGIAIGGFRAAGAALGSLVTASLEYRGEADAAAREIRELGAGLAEVKARAGDALLPVLQGLGRATKEVRDRASEWLKENRELIATKLVGWVAELAGLLAGPVVRGVQGVVGATTALKAIWQGVKIVINEWFALLLTGVEKAVYGLGRMAAAVGQRGLYEQIRQAQAAVKGLGAEFETSSGASQKVLDELIAKLLRNDEAAGDVTAEIKRIIQEFRRLGEEAAKEPAAEALAKTTEAAKDSAKAVKGVWEQYMEVTAAARALAAEQDAVVTAARAAARDTAVAWAAAGEGIGQAFGVAFGGAIAQQATFAEAVRDSSVAVLQSVIQQVTASVTARAVEAAAGTMAWSAALGPIGLAVGVGLAAAVSSAVLALLQGMPRAQRGMVVGGQPGRDSVMAWLEPGEVVQPLPQARRDVSSGVAAVAGDVRPAKLEVHFHQAVPLSEAEQARVLRHGLVPALRRLGPGSGW